MALSVPIITTTAGLRGVLEAYQKFGIINIIRTFLGIFSFLGPLLCLIFTNSLFWITLILVVIRCVVWILYLRQCFKLNTTIKNERKIDSSLFKPIFKLSGWMTISNIIVPLISYMDRFLIGSLASAAAITFYATPYEVVTKLLLIPGAVVGVLFPAFSANYSSNPDFTKKLSIKAVKYIFIILYPIVLLIMVFAKEGMNIWLGQKFVENSTVVLQLLAAGVLFNSLAYIPFTFLQGIGRPDITAKINLFELPVYLFAMWFSIKAQGIKGAAIVWLIRMFVDAVLMFVFAKKQIVDHLKYNFKLQHLFILILIATSVFPVLIYDIFLKFILTVIIIVVFSFISWKYILQKEERIFLISRIKFLTSKN